MVTIYSVSIRWRGFCRVLMNGKSYMVKLTIVDEESLQALDRCKENRKIPVLLSHAVYDFVRTDEGKKILDRLAPRNSVEKKYF